jgi:beta-xylosidase
MFDRRADALQRRAVHGPPLSCGGTTWTKTSEELAPIKDKVMPLIDQAAANYVTANTGWPKRTEACDKVVSR